MMNRKQLGLVMIVAIFSLDGPIAAQAQARPGGPAGWCTRLLPAVQPLVKPTLHLAKADDAGTDDLHAGEAHYISCDFRGPSPQAGQMVVSLHDNEPMFDDPNASGYARLPGFGDNARYSVKGAMGMLWVDVVRGDVACETRFVMDSGAIPGDWKQAGGKACMAGLALK